MENVKSPRRKIDHVRAAALRDFGRHLPDPALQIDVAPAGGHQFALARERQQQQLEGVSAADSDLRQPREEEPQLGF